MFHSEVGSSGSLNNDRENRFIGMWERVEKDHSFQIIRQGKTSGRHLVENVNKVVDLIRKIFHITTTIFMRVNNVVFDGFREAIKLSGYAGRGVKLS